MTSSPPCTFCLLGAGKCRELGNLRGIRFICSELDIDFDKKAQDFGFQDLSLDGLTVPLCNNCHNLMGHVERIELGLAALRGQLDNVLARIIKTINSSPTQNLARMGPKGTFEPSITRNCQLLRTEIVRSGKRISDKIPYTTNPDLLRSEYEPDIPILTKSPYEGDEVATENSTTEESNEPQPVAKIENVEVKMESFDEYFEEEDIDTFATDEQTGDDSLEPALPGPSSVVKMAEPTPFTTGLSQTNPPANNRKKYPKKKPVSIKCPICPARKGGFASLPLFQIHVRNSHKSEKVMYECSLPNCSKEFPVKILLQNHLTYHAEEKTKQFGCEDCEIRFNHPRGLEEHLGWHQKVKGQRDGRCYCRFCKMTSALPSKVREHELHFHEEKLTHSCTHCGHKYSSYPMLETHVQIHETEGPYRCLICEADTTCPTGAELEQHLVNSHVPRDPTGRKEPVKKKTFLDFNCKLCGQCFASQARLDQHIGWVHEERKPFSCELCTGKDFSGELALLKHIRIAHESAEKKFNCSKCKKQFSTAFMLGRHVKYHKYDGKRPFACDLCEVRFATEEALTTHKASFHMSHEKRYYCRGSGCGKSSTGKTYLIRHERLDHPELLIHNCTLCDKMYTEPSHLETHMKTHPENSNFKIEDDSNTDPSTTGFTCTVCPWKFLTGTALADHLLKHTGEDTISCNLCSVTFKHIGDLRRHKVSAHGVKKPFKCHVCKKGFTEKNRFKMHLQTHENPDELMQRDPKTCKDCGLQFPTVNLLRAHRRMAHVPKPTKPERRVCEICGKNVAGGGLNSHMRSHRGVKKHSCYFCENRFVRYDALRYHLSTHTKEKPYMCQLCPAEFNQLHCLKGHTKSAHQSSGPRGFQPQIVSHNNPVPVQQLQQYQVPVFQWNPFDMNHMRRVGHDDNTRDPRMFLNLDTGEPLDFNTLMNH